MAWRSLKDEQKGNCNAIRIIKNVKWKLEITVFKRIWNLSQKGTCRKAFGIVHTANWRGYWYFRWIAVPTMANGQPQFIYYHLVYSVCQSLMMQKLKHGKMPNLAAASCKLLLLHFIFTWQKSKVEKKKLVMQYRFIYHSGNSSRDCCHANGRQG